MTCKAPQKTEMELDFRGCVMRAPTRLGRPSPRKRPFHQQNRPPLLAGEWHLWGCPAFTKAFTKTAAGSPPPPTRDLEARDILKLVTVGPRVRREEGDLLKTQDHRAWHRPVLKRPLPSEVSSNPSHPCPHASLTSRKHGRAGRGSTGGAVL